jgi:hypothetical protein
MSYFKAPALLAALACVALSTTVVGCADDAADLSMARGNRGNGARINKNNVTNDDDGDDAGTGDASVTPKPTGTTDGGEGPAPEDTSDGGARSDASAGGQDAAPPPPPSFFPAGSTYTATTGPNTVNNDHAARGFAQGNPAGQPCLNCHANDFAMAGTVYLTAAGTTPAAKVEVLLKNTNGTTLKAFTDNAGNFYVGRNGTTVGAGALVGMRNATGEKVMVSSASADCNTCHKPNGSAGVINF